MIYLKVQAYSTSDYHWNVISTRKTADYFINANRGVNFYENNQQNREGKKMTMHAA